MKRKILVILSNRLNRLQPPRFVELESDDEGTILKRRKLGRSPAKPIYHEVWENDEGRTDFDSCYRMKRKYGHKLEKKRS